MRTLVKITWLLLALACTDKLSNERSRLPSLAVEDTPDFFSDSYSFPSKLSELGVFTSLDSLDTVPNFIPYELNQGFWSDGATKTRWIYIESGSKLAQGSAEFLSLPSNAMVIKHFSLPTQEGQKNIETRLLVKRSDGWLSLTYRWNTNGDEATLLTSDEEEEIQWQSQNNEQKTVNWNYPAGTCSYCHNGVTDTVAGLTLENLNTSIDYGQGEISQLEAWNLLGWFPEALAKQLPLTSHTPQNDDTAIPVSERARSYLDLNCSFCHRPGGFEDGIDFRKSADLSDLLTTAPRFGNMGVSDATILSQEPEKSVLYLRMLATDNTRMPYVSSHVPDETGLSLIKEWLEAGEFD